jgi:hypothetical protein
MRSITITDGAGNDTIQTGGGQRHHHAGFRTAPTDFVDAGDGDDTINGGTFL